MTFKLSDLFLRLKGGTGSGNFGHFGRKGRRGGSSSKKIGLASSLEDISTLDSWYRDNTFDLKGHLSKNLFDDTEEAIGVVQRYTGNYHQTINETLRNSKGKVVSKDVKSIDNLMEKSALPENIEVSRGFGYGFFKDKNVGDTFVDYGFTSTSFDPSVGIMDKAIIDVPKGTKALYLSPVSVRSSEREVLLERGLTYKIDDITDSGVKLSVVD